MTEIEEKIKVVLEGLGFKEKENKEGLWVKSMSDGFAHFDFRKSEKGRFYVTLSDGKFEDNKLSKKRQEYIDFRKIQNDDTQTETTTKTPKPEYIPPPNDGHDLVLRGNETEISKVVNSRRLDMIAKVAKDGIGEGVLYHDLGKKIGLEPSAELVDMICSDMGGITVDIVEQGMRRHIDPEGNEYNTYYAEVKAKDTISGSEGFGCAEQVIDYDEMKNNGRCFSLTLAVRKAERNAKQRLIPVPRKALVELVKDLIENNRGKGK
jgi:hypothetical protein